CLHRSSYVANFPFAFTHTYPFVQSGITTPYGGIPSMVHTATGHPLVDPKEHDFETMALKALGGFILILNENGEIYYASENIEAYLGFHQSDILHQPLFEMIHSEDREDIKQQLAWNYNTPPYVTCLQDLLTPAGMHYLERNVNARFRCLLDNTCGFLRIDIRGKLMSLHGLPHSFVLGRSDANSSGNTVLGLVAVCSPFVPPNVIDQPVEDPILKTKHSLDFTLISMDSRVRAMLEIEEKHLPKSFYSIVHVDDALCLAEAHKEVIKNSASGLLIYRLISLRSRRTYWVQSSCRMFYKNGKPESIGLTHRLLTEVEGTMLLDKRASLKAKLLSFDDSLLQSPLAAAAASNMPNAVAGLAMKLVNNQATHEQGVYMPQNISTSDALQPPVLMRSTAQSTTSHHGSTRGRKRRKHTIEQQPVPPFNPQHIPVGIVPNEQQVS
ncbi:unnamed protein product, partial [Toxocara canis]|uniref:PAS domain-containing protein n=1 Tax=Toxocara canis TaxID=6265 RepID=A0A183UH68_TOXCA